MWASHLFHGKQITKDAQEATKQALALYKYALRTTPLIHSLYNLDVTIPMMKKKVRQEFDKSRHIKDKVAIDFITMRKATELNECLSMFKTKHHVEQLFTPTDDTTFNVVTNLALSLPGINSGVLEGQVVKIQEASERVAIAMALKHQKARTLEDYNKEIEKARAEVRDQLLIRSFSTAQAYKDMKYVSEGGSLFKEEA